MIAGTLEEIVDLIVKSAAKQQDHDLVRRAKFLAVMTYVTDNIDAINNHIDKVIVPAYAEAMKRAEAQVREEDKDKLPPEQLDAALKKSIGAFYDEILPRVKFKQSDRDKYWGDLRELREGKA
jgi:hypothetical protein